MKLNRDYLTTHEYWEEAQGDIIIGKFSNEVTEWLDTVIKNMNGKSVIEIGCYPGRYLLPFAEKNFIVSGLDFLKGTEQVRLTFEKLGFKVGNFYIGDFNNIDIDERFDVVASFGFIEHFIKFEKIIEKKISLVKQYGYIIIEVPNFLGFFQRVPRFLFDRENFKRHNLKAMQPSRWVSILKQRGFEIIEMKFIGGYRVWYEDQKKRGQLFYFLRGITITLLSKVVCLFSRQISTKHWAPFIVLVAKKE